MKIRNNVMKTAKSASVIGLQPNPTKCYKKSYISHIGPSRRLLLLLRGAGICSSMLHSDCMPIIKRITSSGLWNTRRCAIALSTLALILLMIWYGLRGCLTHCCSTKTRRSINCVVRNGRRGDQNRMWYSNEPSYVPPSMSPRLVIRNRMTPLLMTEDM